jgi:Zn ribbon nucleic-acid-binding protein
MANLQCIVCGRGSTRTVWNNNNVLGTTFVACDFHSQNVIQASVNSGQQPASLKINIPKTHHEVGTT